MHTYIYIYIKLGLDSFKFCYNMLVLLVGRLKKHY